MSITDSQVSFVSSQLYLRKKHPHIYQLKRYNSTLLDYALNVKSSSPLSRVYWARILQQWKMANSEGSHRITVYFAIIVSDNWVPKSSYDIPELTICSLYMPLFTDQHMTKENYTTREIISTREYLFLAKYIYILVSVYKIY